jgi:hypothetical protein
MIGVDATGDDKCGKRQFAATMIGRRGADADGRFSVAGRAKQETSCSFQNRNLYGCTTSL